MANIILSLTNGFASEATSMGNNWLQKNLANGFRKDQDGLRFYAKYEAGGSVLQVITKRVAGQTASLLKDEAMKQLKGLTNRLLGKRVDNAIQENAMVKVIEKAQSNDDKKYGVMKVNGGANAVVALDPYGNKCIDGIMLGIPVKDPVQYSVSVNKKSSQSNGMFDLMDGNPETNFKSDTLVWYDPSALVTINSDKNLIVTKVQGRDYSRKELISNGDINFTVTGHILSNMPEVYPAADVQKFIQVMQYKGTVRVNNLILDQFNIDHIVIKDFSLSPKEGYKSQQDYTFNAVGTMPAKEVKITEDTINIIDNSLQQATKEKGQWQKLLDKQLEGITTDALNATNQGLSLAIGLLDGI